MERQNSINAMAKVLLAAARTAAMEDLAERRSVRPIRAKAHASTRSPYRSKRLSKAFRDGYRAAIQSKQRRRA